MNDDGKDPNLVDLLLAVLILLMAMVCLAVLMTGFFQEGVRILLDHLRDN